jgi:hypothetical protein
MAFPEKCPLCSGSLVEGGLVDLGDYNRARHAQWVDGDLRIGFWGGLRNQWSQVHRMLGFRCTSCGHVLLFARHGEAIKGLRPPPSANP